MLSDVLYTALLGPVLLLQGLYVKKRTPELPEPTGDRFGNGGAGPLLRILIVGDSAAAGVGVQDQGDALSGQLKSTLGKSYSLQWRLIAKTGLNTRELTKELKTVRPDEVDIVVSSLGVNDVTAGTSKNAFRQHQLELYDLLISKFSTRLIIVNSVPPIHEFPALPQPLRWYLGRRAKALNSVLTEISMHSSKLSYLNLNFPFDREFFAVDGFHPSKRAYSHWGKEVANLIKQQNY